MKWRKKEKIYKEEDEDEEEGGGGGRINVIDVVIVLHVSIHHASQAITPK